MSKSLTSILPALLIGLGLAAAGAGIGEGLSTLRTGKVVTVKGMVEKAVRADYVSWPLGFAASGNDLVAVHNKVTEAQNIVIAFLQDNGLTKDDFSIAQWRVTDQNANEYGGSAEGKDRYIITATVQVNSTAVDKVLALTTRTAELVQKGVVLNNSTASFRFGGLNAIKPDLLAEATRNARGAAEQFAKDSNTHVGTIARANQGVITILSKGSDMDDPASPDKVVRVVTTLDYYLKD